MKKLISIAVVALLLIGLLAMPVSAEGVTVENKNNVQGEVGESIEVKFYVNDAADVVGAVEGTITYDATVLDYVGIALAADFAALGNPVDELIYVDETKGEIRILGISSVLEGEVAPAAEWFTLTFNVIGGDAGEDVAITLSDLIASDKTGENEVVATAVSSSVKIIKPEVNYYSTMDGATIKTDVNVQGLRFQTSITDLFPTDATEMGVIMLPAALVEEELTLDTPNIAVAKLTSADADWVSLAAGEVVYARLSGSTINGRANIKIAARAYVKVGDTVIYSHNDNDATAILDGSAVKSVAGVAQSIATAIIATGVDGAAVADLLALDKLTDAQVNTLLTFCTDNWAALA
ncbi:MAG: hypothetical protein IK954_03335 [Clostridia bacterium]|nr:hypothetical protein [Clostridia bacterium]